jgi:hypothetical protein
MNISVVFVFFSFNRKVRKENAKGTSNNIIFKNEYFPQRHKVHKEKLESLTREFIIFIPIIKYLII